MPEYGQTLQERWSRSAVAYASFAQRSRLYRETAAALVRRADMRPGMTVVDLACGSGIVTRTILAQFAAQDVSIIATDFSQEMVAVAEAGLRTSTVSFRCEAAEHLSRVVPVPVDRVLCNAAFWQFDRAQVLEQLRQVLKPGGKCAFTLPDWHSMIGEIDALYQGNKLFWMVFEEMAIRGYHLPALQLRPDGEPIARAKRYETDALRLECVERLEVAATGQDYLDFLTIPVMRDRFGESMGVSDTELQEVLAVVSQQIEWVECVVPPQVWQVVVLERR